MERVLATSAPKAIYINNRTDDFFVSHPSTRIYEPLVQRMRSEVMAVGYIYFSVGSSVEFKTNMSEMSTVISV